MNQDNWTGGIRKPSLFLLLLLFEQTLAAPIYPVGAKQDVVYAASLWRALVEENLAGEKARKDEPFVGAAPPHGWILEVLDQNLTVNAHRGFVIVKRNYNGEGVSVETVKANRQKYLVSITVMYQREEGYDEENQNWFWAKYHPNGALFAKEIGGKTVSLAGRVIKGKTPENNGGCIYCHRSAGGGDYIFYPQIHAPTGGFSKSTRPRYWK